MEKYEYYVTSNYPVNGPTVMVGGIALAPGQRKAIWLTYDEVTDLKTPGKYPYPWTVERRLRDAELGTNGTANAGKGAKPLVTVQISQADYDALTVKNPGVMYAIQ